MNDSLLSHHESELEQSGIFLNTITSTSTIAVILQSARLCHSTLHQTDGMLTSTDGVWAAANKTKRKIECTCDHTGSFYSNRLQKHEMLNSLSKSKDDDMRNSQFLVAWRFKFRMYVF
jgi:hypothetical protein